MQYPKFRPINGYAKESIIKMIQDNFTFQSLNEDGQCSYRGENGTKCIVGVFIPDNEYNSTMDNGNIMLGGTDIESVLVKFPNLEQFMPLELEALKLLQVVHDGISSNECNENKSNLGLKNELIQWVNDNVA